MKTNRATSGAVGRNPSIRPIFDFLTRCWRAFQEEQRCRKLRAALYELNDYDLKDIGISRGMIEHIGSNPTVDPRFVGPGNLPSDEEKS